MSISAAALPASDQLFSIALSRNAAADRGRFERMRLGLHFVRVSKRKEARGPRLLRLRKQIAIACPIYKGEGRMPAMQSGE
jgi:hypothetical protein